MDLQNFGFNIYVTQLIFGAVDIPAKFISVLTITFVGRRFSQALSLILAGMCILANIFVPQGKDPPIPVGTFTLNQKWAEACHTVQNSIVQNCGMFWTRRISNVKT